MISPANASTLQEAFPSGTVSTWPVKHSGSLLPTAPILAMRLARPGANSCSEVSSPAAARILSKCNMHLNSLPGGLIVSKEISSRESSTGSIRMVRSQAPLFLDCTYEPFCAPQFPSVRQFQSGAGQTNYDALIVAAADQMEVFVSLF